MRRALVLIAACLLWVPVAKAIDVGSDGSDGALLVTSNVTVDLSTALTGPWDTQSAGQGVYDPAEWAVVFKYSSVDIENSTVAFTNHPSGAPVVWLVQGDVTINTFSGVDVSARSAADFPPGGPGGFRGGRGGDGTLIGSAGLGPGGGATRTDGASGAGGYGSAGQGPGGGGTYGNPRILPLIGGSGGGSTVDSGPGGGGGGAILIAANGTITIDGRVQADGGSGGYGGSGGAIRLIAHKITGSAAAITAIGGFGNGVGGMGRIRLEADSLSVAGGSNPTYTCMILDPNDLGIWPAAGDPRIRVTTVGGVPVPADPHAPLGPGADVFVASNDSVEVRLEAAHIPVEPSRRWSVSVRMVPRSGEAVSVPATFVDGDSLASIWSATVPPLPDQDVVAFQAKAYAAPAKGRSPRGE